MDEKKYEGTCYIGVVGPEHELGECRDSIYGIQIRRDDAIPTFIRATKGYEARQTHLNNFLASKHDYLLLLDHDQIFPEYTLERLRSHGLPYVSGLYMRRRFAPMCPVWFEDAPAGSMPLKIWTRVPEKDTLYPLGASGWGCVLIHREVILAVRALLKGEDEILEDDMDLYPYDLERTFQAIRGLDELSRASMRWEIMRPVFREYVKALKEELRPLRAKKDVVGSDIRFPFFAKLAGYQLMGDSGVQCGHVLNYPLMPSDYTSQPPESITELEAHLETNRVKEEKEIQDGVASLVGGENA